MLVIIGYIIPIFIARYLCLKVNKFVYNQSGLDHNDIGMIFTPGINCLLIIMLTHQLLKCKNVYNAGIFKWFSNPEELKKKRINNK